MTKALLTLLFLALLPPETVRAEVISKIKIVYYDVSGISADELRREMFAKGPQDASGSYFGYTHTKFEPRFRKESTAVSCRVGRADVLFKAKITLPKLRTRQGMTPYLLARWDRFVAVLERHERGHILIGRRMAHRLDVKLKQFVGSTDCAGVEVSANDVASKLESIGREHDRDYDRLTFHGALQGAYFH